MSWAAPILPVPGAPRRDAVPDVTVLPHETERLFTVDPSASVGAPRGHVAPGIPIPDFRGPTAKQDLPSLYSIDQDPLGALEVMDRAS